MLACFFSKLCSKRNAFEVPSPEEEVLASESNVMYMDSSRMSVEEILTAHFELGEQDDLLSLQDALGSAIKEPIYAEIKAVHNALVGQRCRQNARTPQGQRGGLQVPK